MTSYHGGKQKIGEKIAEEIFKATMTITQGQYPAGYCEPFCGMLGVFRHIIDFIEDDEFIPNFKEILGSNKLVDLVADSVDTAFVGCIEMDDETFVDVVLRFLIFVDEVDYSGCFAGAGGSIQEQIGKVFIFQHG